MKKIFNIIVLAAFFSITSCTWTIPEKISVSTKATYGFNVGNVDKSFDSYFDASSLGSSGNGVNMTMYDYFPGKQNEKIKKFLLEVPLQEIPIDFTSYFNDLDLSSKIRGLSFDKQVSIPNIPLNYNLDVSGQVIYGASNYGSSSTASINNISPIVITNEVNCTIETGTLTMEIVLPSSWTGVSVSYTSNPTIGGTATLANATPTISPDGKTCVFTLDDAVFTAGDITVNIPSLDFSGLTPSLDFNKNITVKVYSSITKIKEIQVTLDVDNVSVSDSQGISTEFGNTIEKIYFGNSGLKGTYINTFPTDNDITIAASSTFIGMSNSTATLASNTTTATPITGLYNNYPTDTSFENPISTSTTIDFAVDITLPNATAANPKVMKLKHVVPGSSYQLKIDLEPDINWNQVDIKSNAAATADKLDTGLNIGQVFGSITSSFGGDFNSKCSIKSVPIYLFASKPDISSLDGAEFVGSLKMYYSNNGTEKYTAGGEIDFMPNDRMPFSEYPTIEKEGTGADEIVITDVSTLSPSASDDMKDLIKNTKDQTTGSVILDYSISFAKTGTPTISITKADFADSAVKSIKMIAYIAIPLEFEATGDVDLDIMSIMGKAPTDDLLDRSKPTDISDKEDYLNAVRYVRIIYNADALPFCCMPTNQVLYKNSTVYVDWDGSASLYQPRFLDMEEDDITVEDFQSLLTIYPLTPELKLRIPEGSFSIPRESKIALNVKLCVKTDPDYEIGMDLPF